MKSWRGETRSLEFIGVKVEDDVMRKIVELFKTLLEWISKGSKGGALCEG